MIMARARASRRSIARSSTSYVKFSDKLTDSLEDITKMINEHKGMIDSIQEIALELTEAIGKLNTLALKYAKIVNDILDAILPIVSKVPLIPDNIEKLLVKMERWTQKIIDNEKPTAKTIADVRTGLRTGDVTKIKAHSSDLKKVTRSITAIIPKS
jgi:methyl-accepting chemotaxis protein